MAGFWVQIVQRFATKRQAIACRLRADPRVLDRELDEGERRDSYVGTTQGAFLPFDIKAITSPAPQPEGSSRHAKHRQRVDFFMTEERRDKKRHRS